MQLNCFRLEDLIDLIERRFHKLEGRKNSPGINRWGLGVPLKQGAGKLLKIK